MQDRPRISPKSHQNNVVLAINLMKLAYLYIEEHKVLKSINIPINGNHKCDYSTGSLTLKVSHNNLDYYNGLSCSAII
jgi:hypothetical protein